jgi:RND superfamily putative drug exporter
MFERLGAFLSKWWYVVIGCWLVAFVWLHTIAPPFNKLAKEGEFVFLPETMPSRQGEALMNKAFPGRQTSSNIVIVAVRDDEGGLTDDDRSFIDDTLRSALEGIRDKVNSSSPEAQQRVDKPTILLGAIHTFSDTGIGNLLISDDGKATLVTIELPIDFQDTRNWLPVQQISDLLGTLQRGDKLPKGLQLALTGSATLGRDLSTAEAASARNTGTLTIGLVVVLLAVIYRAPLIALVPLLTLFIAVDVSLHLLTVLAQAGYVPLFKGLKEYTTVITYGPGIDYCLFLIARYEENLEGCSSPKKALADAIGQVGAAILASAATVTCGIGMLTFAQFGKFHQAGIGISVTLAITLVATLTLTPALLFLVGHWAFWPKPGVRCSENKDQGAEPGEHAVQQDLFQPMWNFMSHVIERHPMRLLLLTITGMIPFVVLAVAVYGNVNYGLLESLPKAATSAAGARELAKHFPAGITGPVSVLIQNSSVDFRDSAGIALIDDLVGKLMKDREGLQIADIRSVSKPLGAAHDSAGDSDSESSFQSLLTRKAKRDRSVEHYVASAADLDGHVTEMEIVLSTNPFSIESVRALDRLSTTIHAALPVDQSNKTTVAFVGPTASVRDVNTISRSDQQRIYLLVVICVFAILVVLLRSFYLSVYLMLTVLLSYLATLGVTWLVFYGLDPAGFIGLDWTVPLFLFVVLIAVGEDYNIFLVTRIHEEQLEHGPTRGITVALAKTGSIITSCGFIMAGTFASLSIGTLARMQQLGFALAFGVLLDTFVIRPIIVPAFLAVMYDERYGNLSRYLK